SSLCLYKISPPQFATEAERSVSDASEEPDIQATPPPSQAEAPESSSKRKRRHVWLAYPLLAVGAAAVLYGRTYIDLPRARLANVSQSSASAPGTAPAPILHEDVAQPRLSEPTARPAEGALTKRVRRNKAMTAAEETIQPVQPPTESASETI